MDSQSLKGPIQKKDTGPDACHICFCACCVAVLAGTTPCPPITHPPPPPPTHTHTHTHSWHAAQVSGIVGLQDKLAAEAEEAKPEFLKQRPKYYYYYRWMTERIQEHCAELPAPVLDKLLTMDAGELDLLLQHESAIKSKVGLLPGSRGGRGSRALRFHLMYLQALTSCPSSSGPPTCPGSHNWSSTLRASMRQKPIWSSLAIGLTIQVQEAPTC